MKNVALLVSLVCVVASVRGHATELFRTPLIQNPERTETGPYFNLASQFTGARSLQSNGQGLENPLNQKLNSSVTQATVGYNFTPSFGVELDAPFIHREYRRKRGTALEEDETAGFGDISLMANWTAIRVGSGNRFFGMKFSGGVKLPTGDSDRLGEKSAQTTVRVLTKLPTLIQIPQFTTRVIVIEGMVQTVTVQTGVREIVIPPEFEDISVPVPSDINGKDLALGSGSVDGILATNLYTRWERLFLSVDAQYVVRTEGAFDYCYGNTFQWSGGPGVYVTDGPDIQVAIQLICSGEVKEEDEFRGQELNNTELNTIFLGPAITVAWKDRFSAQLGGELPVHIDNTGRQVVPDFRVQASISWQF